MSTAVNAREAGRIVRRVYPVLALVFSTFGCGVGESGLSIDFDLPFTPDTNLGVTTVEAYGGTLEVTLAAKGDPCGTRDQRKAYDQQSMIRIALVAVDQAGALSLVDEPWLDAEERAVPSVNGFTAFFVPESKDGVDLDAAHLNGIRATGTVTVDVVPNYDTGRVLGQYDLRFGNYTYRGRFDSSYCERNLQTNVKLLAWDLMTWCGAGFDAPLQPGSLWSNTPRLNTKGVIWVVLCGRKE